MKAAITPNMSNQKQNCALFLDENYVATIKGGRSSDSVGGFN